MKILWVNPEFLDYRISTYQQLNNLCGNNLFVVFSGLKTPRRIIDKMKDLFGDHSLPLYKDRIFTFGDVKSDFANTGLVIRYPKELIPAIKRINPDVIICEGFYKWSPYALLQAKRMGIPAYVAYERTKHTERNCPLWRVWSRRILSPLIKGFIINGRLTREYLESIGYGKKNMIEGCMAADSLGLANAVNGFSINDRMNLKKELKLEGNGLVYLFVGQMVERKGVSFLLSAWKEHVKQYLGDSLLLVGTGLLLEDLKEQYLSISSIKFIGKVNYEEIYKYYAIADIFINPTLEDNWSLVIPEAMACGLPVSTSIYNGCYPELVKDNLNGFTFNTKDEKSILNVLHLFHLSDLQKMGQLSIQYEAEYSSDKVAERVLSLIDKNK